MPNGMGSSGEEANFASVLLHCVAVGFIATVVAVKRRSKPKPAGATSMPAPAPMEVGETFTVTQPRLALNPAARAQYSSLR